MNPLPTSWRLVAPPLVMLAPAPASSEPFTWMVKVFRERTAPGSSVSRPLSALAPSTGEFGVPDGMRTESVRVGATPPVQFAPVCHDELTAPVHTTFAIVALVVPENDTALTPAEPASRL